MEWNHSTQFVSICRCIKTDLFYRPLYHLGLDKMSQRKCSDIFGHFCSKKSSTLRQLIEKTNYDNSLCVTSGRPDLIYLLKTGSDKKIYWLRRCSFILGFNVCYIKADTHLAFIRFNETDVIMSKPPIFFDFVFLSKV